MKKLIHLTLDLAILPHHISAIKYIDEEHCAIFMVGQYAIDGSFLVDIPMKEAMEMVNDALEEEANGTGGAKGAGAGGTAGAGG
jgi:hypothetical protein